MSAEKREPARVCAIVVAYRSEDCMRDCLESLARQTYKNFFTVVIDNASFDKSAEIASGYGAHVIRNEENLGFAAANNQGVKFALENGGCDYFLLINPDAVADESLVAELVGSLEKDDAVGVAQAKVFLLRDRELLNTAGIRHHYLYFGYCEKYNRRDDETADRDIAVASGSCMMFKRSLYERLGYLFNEDFFMYHEDTDFCIRARLRGFRVVLSARASAWHDYRFGRSPLKFFHMEKNRLYLLLQNYRAATLILLLPAILFTEVQVMGFSFLRGWWAAKLKSYLWLLKNAGRVMQRRRAVQSARVVSDRQLMERFVTDISFPEVDNPVLRLVTNPLLKLYLRFVSGALGVFEKAGGPQNAC